MPVVAAIHGACLGGGLETALACRYRVRQRRREDGGRPARGHARPHPGSGRDAAPAAPHRPARGARPDPHRPLAQGAAGAARRDRGRGRAPRRCWCRPRAPPRSGSPGARRRRAHPGISVTERLLRPVIFRKARASVREKTGGHYPAPPAAIDVVEKGTAGPLARGLEIEARAVRRAGRLRRLARARLRVPGHPGDQEGRRISRGHAAARSPQARGGGGGADGRGDRHRRRRRGGGRAAEGHHVRGARARAAPRPRAVRAAPARAAASPGWSSSGG